MIDLIAAILTAYLLGALAGALIVYAKGDIYAFAAHRSQPPLPAHRQADRGPGWPPRPRPLPQPLPRQDRRPAGSLVLGAAAVPAAQTSPPAVAGPDHGRLTHRGRAHVRATGVWHSRGHGGIL